MRTTLLAALIAVTCLWPTLTQAQTSSGGDAGRVSWNTWLLRRDVPSRSAAIARPPVELGATDRPPHRHRRHLLARTCRRLPSIAGTSSGPARTYAPQYSRSRGFDYGGYGGGYGYGAYNGYITDPFGYIGQPDSAAPAVDRYMRGRENQEGYLRLRGRTRERPGVRRRPLCAAPSPNSAAAAGGASTPDHIASNSGLRDTTRIASSCGFARMTSSRIGARSPDATNVRNFAPQPDHPRRFT